MGQARRKRAQDTLYWEIPITDVFSTLIMAHEPNIPVCKKVDQFVFFFSFFCSWTRIKGLEIATHQFRKHR